jgi:hypothetical protein
LTRLALARKHILAALNGQASFFKVIVALDTHGNSFAGRVKNDYSSIGRNASADPGDRHLRANRQFFDLRAVLSPGAEQKLIILAATQGVAASLFAGKRAVGRRERQPFSLNSCADRAGPANMSQVLQ